MRFDVVGELTAQMTRAGRVSLRPVRPAPVSQRWTGVARAVHVRTPLAYGLARLVVCRGVVDVTWSRDGGTDSKCLSGPGRYLAAQTYLRELRREAERHVESELQLAQVAR